MNPEDAKIVWSCSVWRWVRGSNGLRVCSPWYPAQSIDCLRPATPNCLVTAVFGPIKRCWKFYVFKRKCFCWEETCNFCASSNCCWLKRFTRSSTGSGRTLRSSNIFKILIFKYSYICQSTDATHSPHCQCWQQEPCRACDYLDQSEISIVCVDQSEESITWKSWSRVMWTMAAILVMSPPESLIPTMLGWCARLSTVCRGRSRVVLAGTL